MVKRVVIQIFQTIHLIETVRLIKSQELVGTSWLGCILMNVSLIGFFPFPQKFQILKKSSTRRDLRQTLQLIGHQ